MDELIRENPELELQEELPAEEREDEVVETAEETGELSMEDDEDAFFAQFADPEEEPDEIYFTSDFVLSAENFLETTQYAYLPVAKNSWIMIGLVIVFCLSSFFAKSYDYLMFLPVAALVLCVTQVRRYSNTDKDIQKAYNMMQSKTSTGDMHYHIEFGEYMHITNNDRETPKRDLNEVRQLCETEHYLLLCLDHQLYVPVEKNSVCGENPDEFIDFLRHSCRDLKNKKITKLTGLKKQASYGVIAFVIVTVLTLVMAYFLRSA